LPHVETAEGVESTWRGRLRRWRRRFLGWLVLLLLVMPLLGHGIVTLTKGGEDEAHAGETVQDVAARW
jgi:hypothetical protein